MTALVNCPHCATRVLPMSGRVCPACRKNVDSAPEPDPDPQQVLESAQSFAAEQIIRGAAPSETQRHLTQLGLKPEAAAAVVDNVRVDPQVRKLAARRNMLYGGAWCFGGILVTFYTYQAASSAGGIYVVAWGAILFGGIQFLRGLAEFAGDSPGPN